MKPYWVVVLLLGVCWVVTAFPADHEPVPVDPSWYINEEEEEAPVKLDDGDEEEEDEITNLKGVLGGLARQMILTQLFIEERNRGEGHSGIKKTRLTQSGTRPYHAATHVNGNNALGIHEHPDLYKKLGFNEFSAVLNGIEFRTDHDNYDLHKPVDHKFMHGWEEIDYPDVPPEVTGLIHVDNQVREMRRWFQAWQDQDHSQRNYRKYFKPVLCYLEGAFLTSDHELGDEVEDKEHYKKAMEWFLAQDDTRFTSYTGRKHQSDNIKYLPTIITSIFNGTYPIFAHWDYRIMCHPLPDNLRLNRFRVVDDLATRMALGLTYEELAMSRAARFQLNPADTNEWAERTVRHGLLDRLMGQIPGKDNYNGDMLDDSFNEVACEIKINEPTPLNAAFYHRWYKVAKNDAMGVQFSHRGFADENLFIALNSRTASATTSVMDCVDEDDCEFFYQKISYAIPLEIIYLTPLHNWNPYDIEYKGKDHIYPGTTVTEGGRDGGFDAEKAYNGSNNRHFYHIPSHFFESGRYQRHTGDTGKHEAGVLDKEGKVQRVSPSGNYVFLPEIEGLGNVRTRYPIFPLYGEGNSFSKELEALKDIVMQSNTYYHMFREKPDFNPDDAQPPPKPNKCLEMHLSSGPATPHTHVIVLTPEEQDELEDGIEISVVTSEDISHSHVLMVKYDAVEKKYFWKTCDGNDECWDKHPEALDDIGQC